MYSLKLTESRSRARKAERKSHRALSTSHIWHVCGVAIGLIGSVLLPMTGFFLLTIEWLFGVANIGRRGHIVGTVLLLSAIPLLLLGGYCLDLMEKDQRSDQLATAIHEGATQ